MRTGAMLKIPGVLGLDHIGVAVRPGQLEQQIVLYEAMGFRVVHREEVYGDDGVREALLEGVGGGTRIQLLEPLSAESPVARQMEKNGGRGGVAHVALRVENAAETFAAMRREGFTILDEAPRRGSRGSTIFFVSPKSTAELALGYLLEIVEEASEP